MSREEIRNDWTDLWSTVLHDDPHDVRKATWVVPVMPGAGAGNYMGKYLLKNSMHRHELEAKGFMRRWSRSRNWPGDTLVRVGTRDEQWVRTQWAWEGSAKGALAQAAIDNSEGHPLLERVGTDLALELLGRNRRKSNLLKFRRLIDGAQITPETTVPNVR